MSQRVDFSYARSLFVLELPFYLRSELLTREDFAYQTIGITSRVKACSKVFNILPNVTLEEFVLRSQRTSFTEPAFMRQMLHEAASTPSNIFEIGGNVEAMLNESLNQVMLSTSFQHFLTLSTNVERMLK